jgi:TIR domain
MNVRDKRDVFICHASADKEAVVQPLAQLLQDVDISCWLDEAEILWGDSIGSKVNEGLRLSRFVVVILSANFVQRNWPQREMYSALDLEASSGIVRVLPLLAGSTQERLDVLEQYPLLRDKRYLRWPEDRLRIGQEIHARLGRAHRQTMPEIQYREDRFAIPIPQLKRAPTQLERDRFVQEGFEVTRAYFAEALQRLQAANKQVETDLVEIHRRKFLAKIYLDGHLKAQCKIWLGGPINTSQISYSEGFVEIDSDNSYNDWLSVSEDSLTWESSGLSIFAPPVEGGMDSVGAAAYLWRRFVRTLE